MQSVLSNQRTVQRTGNIDVFCVTTVKISKFSDQELILFYFEKFKSV